MACFLPPPGPGAKVASLAELNETFAAADALDDGRRIARRSETVGQAFAAGASCLPALPAETFDCFAECSAKVDTKARICVRQSFYSVPARPPGPGPGGLVRLHANPLEALVEGGWWHPCPQPAQDSEDLVLDHYLEVLVQKPGALPGSVALSQARVVVSSGTGPTVLI